MTEVPKKNVGICSTCIYLKDCLHKFSNGRVIWFCEHFDSGTPIEKPQPVDWKESMMTFSDNEQFKGLCVNCEHRFYCKQARINGGVWHCEEYL